MRKQRHLTFHSFSSLFRYYLLRVLCFEHPSTDSTRIHNLSLQSWHYTLVFRPSRHGSRSSLKKFFLILLISFILWCHLNERAMTPDQVISAMPGTRIITRGPPSTPVSRTLEPLHRLTLDYERPRPFISNHPLYPVMFEQCLMTFVLYAQISQGVCNNPKKNQRPSTAFSTYEYSEQSSGDTVEREVFYPR